MSQLYRYRNAVDYLADFPGARRESDKLVTEILTGEIDITDRANRAVGEVTVTNTLDVSSELKEALASYANDTLRVTAPSPLDVSASTVTVGDNGSFTISGTPLDPALNGSNQLDINLAANGAGTLATEQQTPVGVEDSTGTQVDPLSRQDTSPVTGSTTTADTDVTLTLGDYRKDVDFFVDTSGAANLTVEVRTSGGTWRTIDTINYGSATTTVESYTTRFAEIRASVDANLNVLEASSKGI